MICLPRAIWRIIRKSSASSFDGRWKYLRWLMKVLTIVSAAIFVLLCPIIRLAVCREQPMGEPKIANWQNINSQLAKRKQPTSAWVASRLFYWNSYRKLLFFCFRIGILPNTLHSSPNAPNPLCLSAFWEVKSIRALFTYSSPLFTHSCA